MLDLLLFYIILFLVAFYIITKAADYFVDEASNLGRLMGMSKLTIGLTIVAVGTSLPEALTSLLSILFTDNYSEFVIGTTMGSNITNILLAFGLFLVFAGKFTTNKRELFNVLALIFTTLVLSIFILVGYVNYIAITLLALYIGYLVYLAKFQKKEILLEEEEILEKKTHSKWRSIIILFFSFLGIYIGAKIVVMSIEGIGAILNIPAAYLTLTTISIATSLPEIAVTISSAKKKEYMIGIGNILGTNVMNVCIIIGLSGLVGHYAIETSLYISSIIFFVLGTLIFSYLVARKKFTPFFGYLFLTMYILYLGSFFL